MNNAETQAKRVAKLKASGGVRRSFELQPATVAALRELRARGAVSDAATVNLAVQAAVLNDGFLRALSDSAVRGEDEEQTR